MVCPLVDDAERSLDGSEVSDGILGEDREPEAREKLGDAVIDLGIEMIGTTGEHDALEAALPDFCDGLLALARGLVAERFLLDPRVAHGGEDIPALDVELRREFLDEAFGKAPLVVDREEGIHEDGSVVLPERVHVVPENFGIARDDRAVVMVAHARVLDLLVGRARIENELHARGEECLDVTVTDLSGIAHRLRGNRLETELVNVPARARREPDAEAEFREEGKPERIVLVHVENARDSHVSARRLGSVERLVAEQALVFPVEEVRYCGLLRLFEADRLVVPFRDRSRAAIVGMVNVAENGLD